MTTPPPPNPIAPLSERIAYEFPALTWYVDRYGLISDQSARHLAFVLGEEDYEARIEAMSRYCEEEVREAVAQFAPLLFSAAFKLQDMAVEWVLQTSGASNRQVNGFAKKIESWESFEQAGTLNLPPYFAANPGVASTFFALFKAFRPSRNEIMHGHGFELHPDGSLDVPGETGQVTLSKQQQDAYIAATILIVDCLLTGNLPDPIQANLLQRHLSHLSPVHGQAIAAIQLPYLRVEVTIPAAMAQNQNPYSAEFAVAEIWERMHQVVAREEPTITRLLVEMRVICQREGAPPTIHASMPAWMTEQSVVRVDEAIVTWN